MVRLMPSATAITVLLCCTVASAAPRDEEVYRLPPELEGRARIVKVHAPSATDPNAKPSDGLAEWEAPAHPSNIVIEVINDEAVARGVTATGTGAEAVVFSQMLDSGYGAFLDNTPGTVQWHRMIPGLGFQLSIDTLSSFMARVYTSADSLGPFHGTGSFTLELWDGDPLGVQDVTCSVGGVPAPIPGTTCSWTDLPEGVVYDLKCVFPAKVTLSCDRVFGVVWSDDLCRWAWRLSEGFMTGGSETSPTVGAGDALGFMYACEQYGDCATPSGYNAGFCCEDQGGDPGTVACDHTDADPNNWIPAGGGCNPGDSPQPTYCQDDAADHFYTFEDEAPLYYNNFVGQLSARTDVVMQVVPMSVDVIPGEGPLPSDVTIDGNSVTIDQAYPGGERHLWLEIHVSDWDPGDTGLTVKAWLASLDSSGYFGDPSCALEPWQPACTDDADCIAAQGPIGWETSPLKGGCNLPGLPPDVCSAGFVDIQRLDYIFKWENSFGGVDQSTLDYRYGATKSGPGMVSPHIGDMYLGTLTLKTTCDCPAGDFSVGLKLPNRGSNLVDGDSQFIPMLGVVGADVIFPLGQCCNISVAPTVCISDTVTRCECEALGIAGGFNTYFNTEYTCADPCIECQADEDCADGDACTVDTCVDQFCVHTPVTVPAGNCCDYLTVDAPTDIGGLGTITPLGSDQCTFDYCDDAGACAVGDACGVPTFDILEGQACCDDEPCLTVNDTCMADASCVGFPMDKVPCTNSATCEALAPGLGCCDVVIGFCHCGAPGALCCGDDECDPGENPCNCPDDCGAPVSSETNCADGIDNDCDGLIDSADLDDCGPIPTVSAWGLIVMGLLLLVGTKVYFNRRRTAQA